jgi:hypothetical protein
MGKQGQRLGREETKFFQMWQLGMNRGCKRADYKPAERAKLRQPWSWRVDRVQGIQANPSGTGSSEGQQAIFVSRKKRVWRLPFGDEIQGLQRFQKQGYPGKDFSFFDGKKAGALIQPGGGPAPR